MEMLTWCIALGPMNVCDERRYYTVALEFAPVPDCDLVHPLGNLDKHVLLYSETIALTCPWPIRINQSKIEVPEKLQIIGLVGLEAYVRLLCREKCKSERK